jgi:hypothetical protein
MTGCQWFVVYFWLWQRTGWSSCCPWICCSFGNYISILSEHWVASLRLNTWSRALFEKLVITVVKIPNILQESKVHYHIHKILPLFPTLNYMNPVYVLSSCFYFNIILPSVPRPSKRSLSFRFLYQSCICISFLLHACYMSYPSHSPWFYRLVISG